MPQIKCRIIYHTIANRLPRWSTCLKIQCVLCSCLLVSLTNIQAQQEIMYSQYMYNMININPAYAGNRAGDNITSMYRKQWMDIEGAPTTFSISWDRGTEDVGGGLRGDSKAASYGFQLYSDKLGIETSQGFQAFYSYRIKFTNSFLSMGISAGALNYHASYSKVATSQGSDPLFQEDINTYLPTAGMGALYTTPNWYVGLSAPALLKTKIINNKYQITTGANSQYFLTTGYIFDAAENLKLKPSILLQAVKGESLHFDLNMNAWIQNTIGLGISYRHKNSIVGMVQVQVTPRVNVGYAYDCLTSSMRRYSAGSHELLLRFEFNRPENQRILSTRYY